MDPARLKKIPVFADLSDEQLGHIAALAAEVSVPESKELVREGDYSYDVLAIEEGTASVDRDGEHIADLGPGDVFGEMGVLRARAAQRHRRRHLADAARDAHELGHPPAAEDRAQGRRAPARGGGAAQRSGLTPAPVAALDGVRRRATGGGLGGP